MTAARWYAGVDVGGEGKGFHLALLRGQELLIEREGLKTPEAVLRSLEAAGIRRDEVGAIGIDSPQNWAPGDQKSRPCEREYRSLGLSGIYFTPNQEYAGDNDFYDWVRNGLRLYDFLAEQGIRKTIEVFPTGSWSVWCGSRKKSVSRARWTTRGIAQLEKHFGIDTGARATNQDKRDAVAAAVTAQLFDLGDAKPVVGNDDSSHRASLVPGIVVPRSSIQ